MIWKKKNTTSLEKRIEALEAEIERLNVYIADMMQSSVDMIKSTKNITQTQYLQLKSIDALIKRIEYLETTAVSVNFNTGGVKN